MSTVSKTGKSPQTQRTQAPQQSQQPKPGANYTVKKGDSLWDISRKAYGDGNRWGEIAEANKGKVGADGLIHPGARLHIPADRGKDKVVSGARQQEARRAVGGGNRSQELTADLTNPRLQGELRQRQRATNMASTAAPREVGRSPKPTSVNATQARTDAPPSTTPRAPTSTSPAGLAAPVPGAPLPSTPPVKTGLGVGDKSAQVKSAERMLKRAGFSPGKVDREFTANTEKAVKEFQSAAGMAATGQIDAKTMKRLKGVDRRIQRSGGMTVGPGQRGARVLKVEQRLKKLGYDVGKVDGTFDQQTGRAVRAFKTDQPGRQGGGAAIGKPGQKLLRQETAALAHDPYHARVKPSARRRELDRVVEKAARKTHADGSTGLGLGSEGRSVRYVQGHLKSAGFDPKHVDGKFDERTEGALKSYQRREGIPVTGRVDAQTWRHLRHATLEARGPTTPKQEIGERSSAVKRTEKLLKRLGYNPGKVDGTYTAATERAVDRFRARRRLGRHDGVGPNALKAIRKAVRAREANGPISAQGRRDMRNLVQRALAGGAGRRPMGWCLKRVQDYLQAGHYGGIGGGKMPRLPYARNFAEYLNEGRRYARMGLRKLNIDNPYKAPPGSIVVVRPGTPGTSHPTAGDIVVAVGGGRFINDGEMGYGGPQNFPKGNNYVLGVYAPR
ncbi:MAG: peptidoglycan-binding protein [Myxococcota bacterium]